MNVFWSLVFVAVIGAVPGIVLTRSLHIGLAVAPAVTLVTAAVGGTVATALSVSATRCILALALVANLTAIGYAALRWRRGEKSGVSWSAAGFGVFTWYALPTIVVLAAFPAAPTEWDSRSIWWFHASWFYAGGATVRRGILEPLLSYSHPDYPPGVPAATATLWHVTQRGRDLWLAQSLTGVLTALAIAGLATSLLVGRRDPVKLGAVSALSLAAVGLAAGAAAHGYVDVLCAALLVASLVGFMSLSDQRLALLVGGVTLAAAAVTKNEGLVFGVLVVAVAVGFSAHKRLATAVTGLVALSPAVAWQLAVRSTGAHIEGDVSPGGILHAGSSVFRSRFWEALRAVGHETYLYLGPAAAVLALLLVLARLEPARSRLVRKELRLVVVLVLAAFLTAFGIAGIYAIGIRDVAWWVASSLVRVSATPKLFALTALAVAARPVMAICADRSVITNGAAEVTVPS